MSLFDLHLRVAWKRVEPMPTMIYPMKVIEKIEAWRYLMQLLRPRSPSHRNRTLVRV